MPFQQLQQQLRDSLRRWNFDGLRRKYEEKQEELKEIAAQSTNSNANKKSEIQKLLKEKERVEAEIEMTSAQIAKRSHKFNSTRTSTFSTAKKVIELEQQVAQTEATLNDKIAEKQKLEAEVTKLSTPTVDSLTNAFYRGLGVDFVKQDGGIFARIKNKEKNDVFLLDLENDDQEKTCEEIWSLFE